MIQLPTIKLLPGALFYIFALFAFANFAYAVDVILDPGHSPGSPGAMSCIGEREYKYNDDLVRNIKQALDRNRISNSVTRSPDQNLALLARVKDTGSAKLFLSVHHDSVQPQFVRHPNKHPVSDKAAGYSLFVSRKNRHFNESVEYAKRIAANLYDMGLRPSTHHGERIKGENRELLDAKLGIYVFDDLVVLKNAQSPAVLLEAGVLVHPEDERRVRAPAFKTNFANAIARALKNI